ncbi:F-box/LRR-repeat protein 13-like isoform X1 [Corylus avellana]|uniref:F-box/LRR-repeat protein 13-like isoform X1 n=1 Tax=Corylus avellana TaxID=13451 RepID=UPI00286C7AB3|nr:F-box/LRR-repeat protein 13-like isoform X1 [Corylus avellana]XP_059435468.1 F-box/LRR-repeat protein 13-like isoform X1 [Corylus avellana]
METTCVIQKTQKKQKLSEKEDISGNIKGLGSLPEEVLRHILSFLPTKDAVRTSVLSKRWEFLWVSIPNLDFERYTSDKSEPVETELLMNFVDRALCLRDSSVIKRFALSCDVLFDHDASRVYTCISTALNHNVQELNIDIYIGDCDVVFSLPSCLFTCKTLTSLYLNMWARKLKLPTIICFSNLKILTIEYLTFSNEYLTQQLFSSLPVLEELKLDDCSWGDLKFVTISAPKLNSLSIFKMGVQDGDIQRSGDLCLVMIVGDSLKEFYYKGLMFAEYCLYNSFRVEKAEIVTKSKYDRPTNIGRFLWNLLIGLSSVELLRLSSDMVKVLSDSPEFLPHMPMFNNLIDLIIVDYRVDLDCTVLLKILQKSPCLQTLNFSEGISLSLNRKEDDMILDPVPLCFLSHLKCINIGSYFGHEKELLAVKILLKNAVVLDKINITCPASYDKNFDRQVKVLTQLLELPRRSQNCKIRALTV